MEGRLKQRFLFCRFKCYHALRAVNRDSKAACEEGLFSWLTATRFYSGFGDGDKKFGGVSTASRRHLDLRSD